MKYKEFDKHSLEYVTLKAIQSLKSKCKLQGVRLSNSKHKNSIIDLSDIDEKDLYNQISRITNLVYLHEIEPAKDSWYQINGLWKPIINAGVIELCKILPYMPLFDKNHLYRIIGIEIGKNTTIAPRVQFDYFHPELITIGDNCLIGDCAKIWTHEFGLDYFGIGSVRIGNNVRIGGESVIFPSIIGDNVLINFGAFIYGDIPSNSIVKGREKSSYVLP